MINAYKVLSVDQNVSTDGIDEAFEKAVSLAKKKYADKPASLEATLDDLKDARRVLLDENSRAELDKELESSNKSEKVKSNNIDIAMVLFEKKLFRECIVLCDKVLEVEPSNSIIKNLRNMAHKEMQKNGTNVDKRVEELKKRGYSTAQIATELKGPPPSQINVPRKKLREGNGLLSFISRNFFKLLFLGAAIYAFFTIDAFIPLRYDLDLMSGEEKARYEAQIAAKRKADRLRREADYQRRLDEYTAYNRRWYYCQLQLVLSSRSPGKVTTRDKVRECGPIPKKPTR